MLKDPLPRLNPYSRYHSEFAWNEIAKDTWIDESSGLIWLPRQHPPCSHHVALQGENRHRRLPTAAEWSEANSHGIRRFLPDMEGFWYWSSTLSPTTQHPFTFAGSSGRVKEAYPKLTGFFHARYIKRLE